MKTNHIQLNDSRSPHHEEYQPTWDYVTKSYIQSPDADRQEAAHYVHDHELSTQDLEDWL